MFIKHKPRLYFDENFPVEAIDHFRSPYWKKRLWITSAGEQGHQGQSDRFHYSYCQRHGYTLVTLDDDFNDDRLYPFTHGKMPGIIIIKAKSGRRRADRQYACHLAFLPPSIAFPQGILGRNKVHRGTKWRRHARAA
jgi:predicted nuclease of predicted toxin-antitoxin system